MANFGREIWDNGAVNTSWQWFNKTLPVTLVNAQLLCYITAVLNLIQGGALSGALPLLFTLGLIGGAAGIANEQKWGYGLALVVSVSIVALQLILLQLEVLRFPWILNFMFDVAIVALLVHPMSRNHQRIWFK